MILQGDCVEQMRELPEASVDAILTDPPYGLEFMGKEWDRLGGGVEPTSTSAGGALVYSSARVRFGASAKSMQGWHEAWATEALRVLKPGGHLLAFGGTRTYHRLACAIEDAGFEIRDCIVWMYGSGFPKSLDVSKAIDKAAGAEREVVGEKVSPDGVPYSALHGERSGRTGGGIMGEPCEVNPASEALTAPATPEAAQWKGWGTALKPAHEPIVLARKPLSGTVAANVLEHGTGALNIDGCRVSLGEGETGESVYSGTTGPGFSMDGTRTLGAVEVTGNDAGRWPANVALSHTEDCVPVGTRKVKTGTAVKRHGVTSEGVTGWGTAPPGTPDVTHANPDGTETITAWECAPDCPIAMLDEQSGESTASSQPGGGGGGIWNPSTNGVPVGASYGDRGGASRFFYSAKSSRGERNAGLDGRLSEGGASHGHSSPGDGDQATTSPRPLAESEPAVRMGARPTDWETADWKRRNGNHHPTVKPIELMRWLVRLVTPPAGTVLDPFTGSGTTGIAAVLEGFDFIGIEREAEYCAIAEARIAWWSNHAGRDTEDVLVEAGLSERMQNGHREAGQLGLLDG